MDNGVNFLNSIEAAKILGVNVSSIKRWTDQGRLECIQTAGGHRKFLMSHLSKFLEENKGKASKANVFTIESQEDLDISYYILKRNYELLSEYMFKFASSGNKHSVFKILSGLYLSQVPLHVIYDKLVTPVMHRIGIEWINGSLAIAEEHFASSAIREAISRLQGIIKMPEENSQRALCVNLSLELHEIALKMVENILELRGFQTFFGGQITPLLDIGSVIEKIKPHRIYISSTFFNSQEEAQKEVDHLFNLAVEHSSEVYIGGIAWDRLNAAHPSVVRRLNTFEEVQIY